MIRQHRNQHQHPSTRTSWPLISWKPLHLLRAPSCIMELRSPWNLHLLHQNKRNVKHQNRLILDSLKVQNVWSSV
uniref:Uncharacterized protein n=1 Tax=Pinctada fucata TaxID=50426 RepID=A0A194AN92_PINFU